MLDVDAVKSNRRRLYSSTEPISSSSRTSHTNDQRVCASMGDRDFTFSRAIGTIRGKRAQSSLP